MITQEQLGLLIGAIRTLTSPTLEGIRKIIEDLAPKFLAENKAVYVKALCGLIESDRDFKLLWQEDKLAKNFSGIEANFPQPGKKSSLAVREGVENQKTAFVSFDLTACLADNEPMALTRYTTWIDVKPADTPDEVFEKMRAHSFVHLLHQDSFEVPKTLKQAEQLFKQAVLWKPLETHLDDLVSKVGQLMFLLAHNHRDIRGTAATSEWLERALYEVNGFKMASDSKRLPDLIAFANPFSLEQYLKAYKASFILHPVE
jgi:hypothetical protein